MKTTTDATFLGRVDLLNKNYPDIGIPLNFTALYIMENTQLNFIPILMQTAFAAAFVAAMIGLSHIVGPRRKSLKKDENFECGIQSYGNARIPFSVKYFLVAILFVLFDIEVIFLYPWAVNFKALGFAGLWKMFLFMGTLLIGFFYIIKKGALEWE
ncbi:MAG: NADH-quinone oxidoreductase subunit A [Chitinophagales bacterium]